MDRMVDEYLAGSEVVYGVRSSRDSDSFFKRFTAEGFYKLLAAMGVEVVFNHADYRLISSRVLKEFANYREVNLYLRGMVPLVGFRSSSVYYERHERLAGESHYPLSKMINLAIDGITSLSTKPLRMITVLGMIVAFISFVGVIWSLVVALCGASVPGWASMTCIICFIGGVQLTCIGVIGEYIGKIYLEVKQRPRYIISERTEEQK
jgi:glycosyltransferase involved in cell wall biosynthesis